MKKILMIPVAAAALTLSLTACGADPETGVDGGSSPPADSTPVNPSGGGTITGDGNGKGSGEEGGDLTPAQRKSLAKVVECMRKKGYDMPEPTSPVIAPKNVEKLDPDKVNKDSQECAAQRGP